MMRLPVAIAAAILLSIAAGPVRAEVFMYTDADGNILLTDTPRSGLKLASVSVERRVIKPGDYKPAKNAASAPGGKLQLFTRYSSIIKKACDKYRLDPELVRAVIQVESQFNPNAKSRTGAVGLMQLMPVTAQQLGVIDRYDPEQNIEGGVKYLRYLIERFDGNITHAVAAYNCGPLNVEKYGKVPPFAETMRYVQKIYSIYKGSKSIALKDHGGRIIDRKTTPDGTVVYNTGKGR